MTQANDRRVKCNMKCSTFSVVNRTVATREVALIETLLGGNESEPAADTPCFYRLLEWQFKCTHVYCRINYYFINYKCKHFWEMFTHVLFVKLSYALFKGHFGHKEAKWQGLNQLNPRTYTHLAPA